jgi:hypothetical protein
MVSCFRRHPEAKNDFCVYDTTPGPCAAEQELMAYCSGIATR